jgi:hypothetical protein
MFLSSAQRHLPVAEKMLPISFMPQRGHGINSHGAAGGNIACHCGYEHQQEGDSGEGERVGDGYTVDHASHLAREYQGEQ